MKKIVISWEWKNPSKFSLSIIVKAVFSGLGTL